MSMPPPPPPAPPAPAPLTSPAASAALADAGTRARQQAGVSSAHDWKDENGSELVIRRNSRTDPQLWAKYTRA
eukprot:12114935-Alexandrium_andersonii.AAC.1